MQYTITFSYPWQSVKCKYTVKSFLVLTHETEHRGNLPRYNNLSQYNGDEDE